MNVYLVYTATEGKTINAESDEDAVKMVQKDKTIVRVVTCRGSRVIYENNDQPGVAAKGS